MQLAATSKGHHLSFRNHEDQDVIDELYKALQAR